MNSTRSIIAAGAALGPLKGRSTLPTTGLLLPPFPLRTLLHKFDFPTPKLRHRSRKLRQHGHYPLWFEERRRTRRRVRVLHSICQRRLDTHLIEASSPVVPLRVLEDVQNPSIISEDSSITPCSRMSIIALDRKHASLLPPPKLDFSSRNQPCGRTSRPVTQRQEARSMKKRIPGESSIARRWNKVIRVTRPERRTTNGSDSIGHPQ